MRVKFKITDLKERFRKFNFTPIVNWINELSKKLFSVMNLIIKYFDKVDFFKTVKTGFDIAIKPS